MATKSLKNRRKRIAVCFLLDWRVNFKEPILLTDRRTIRLVRASLLAVALLACSTARASFIVSVQQVGTSVVWTGSGSLDIDALSIDETGDQNPGLSTEGFALGPRVTTPVILLVGGGFAGPNGMGPVRGVRPQSGSGDLVGIVFDRGVILPTSYVSGAPLSISDTFTNQTIAGLGYTNGFYEWTWGSGASADFLSLQIGPAAVTSVPEPASLALLGLGVVAIGVARRRRSR